MKFQYYVSVIVLIIININLANAQGCVAVRQMGGINPLSTNGYTLTKGEFQMGVSYRYFHSFRHFIGTVEQPQRQTEGGGHDENGKPLGNAVNIYSHAVDLNLSYGLTDRIQLNVAIPYVHNERSQVLRQTSPVADTFRYSVYAKGLADIRISANYWVFDPSKASKGNLMIGLGIKTNSGSHSEMDNAPQADGTTKKVMMDQAIQPGDGGVGFSIEAQGFKQLSRNLYAFGNGYYLFNPRESNGTSKSTPKSAYDYYACPDQYFARMGVMTSVLKSKSLTLSLAGRFEGIPAYDVFGGQVAYRRPGYVVAVESGVSYRKGKHSISLFVPYNFIKNRIQSAADIAKTVQNDANTMADPVTYPKQKPAHGDAAFADYSISVNYGFRFGKLFQNSNKVFKDASSQPVIN